MPVRFPFPKFRLPISVVVPRTIGKEVQVPEREVWDSKAEFILSCLGMSVGLGNVWRFPYMAYVNGGAAFLIPYIFLLVLVGKPLYFFECVIGQFSSLGPASVYRSCCPAMKGVGLASAFLSLAAAFYYNVFIVYSIMYLFYCFNNPLPWSECSHSWGTDDDCYIRGQQLPLPFCEELEEAKLNVSEGVNCRNWQSPGQQFWIHYILNMSKDTTITNLGKIQWRVLIAFLFTWTMIFLCLSRGIKTSGKVVYVTATFPYVILFLLLIVGLSLEGSQQGLKFLFDPKWEAVLDTKVWKRAAGQVFYSLNVTYGGVVMFSSYNKFTNKVKNDSILVTSLDTLTSLIASVAIFSILGNMAFRTKLDISKIVGTGPGLAYEIVPEALLGLPFPQLWCALFFLMLITLGIDSEFADLETFLTGVFDEFPRLRRHRVLTTFAICAFLCVLGLGFTTQGGLFLFDFIDLFGTGNTAILIGFMELLTFMWIYRMNNFLFDAEFMLGSRPGFFWRICWCLLDPPILIVMFIFATLDVQTIDYAGNPYVWWVLVIGWTLTLAPIIQILMWTIYYMLTYHARGLSVWDSFKPTEEWGPADPDIKRAYIERKAFRDNPPTPPP